MRSQTIHDELSKLAKPTYVPAMDGFRGLAVLWIVVLHCWGALGERMPLDGGPLRHFVASGYFGLDLLFIVSGFVLFLPVVYDGNVGDWRDYARRRAARIVPGFWAAVVLTFLVAQVLGGADGGLGAWLSHITFTHQYAHDISDVGFGLNRAMWTMSVEVAFYFLLPFVASIYNRHPFLGLGVAILGSQLWHLATFNLPGIMQSAGISWGGVESAQYRVAYVFPSYMAHFAVGMTAAWLFVRLRDLGDRRLSPQLVSAAGTAAAIGFLALVFLRGRQRLNGELGPFDPRVKTIDRAVLLGVLLLAAALGAPRLQSLLCNWVSRGLGTISYGIYLSHMVLIVLLMPALGLQKGTTNNSDLILLVAAVVPLSILLGVISYRFLETPFRRLARRKRTESQPSDTRLAPVALASSSA